MHEPPSDRPAAATDDDTDSADVVEIGQRAARDRAFDQLYRTEHTAMLRLGYLLTGNRDAAAEVAHDAFIRTYQQWDRLDRPGAYLRTSVVNGCNDHHRRRIRRDTHSVAQVVDRPDPATAEPDEHLADAIGRLRPKRRAAIVLRYYLDLPQAEIAATLGVRQGTVKSLLHRGLADLRAALADAPSGHESARLRSTGSLAGAERAERTEPTEPTEPTATVADRSRRPDTRTAPTAPDASEDLR